jgi:hypothetical protein
MKYLLFLFFAVLLVSCAVTKHRPAFQDEQLAMRYFLDSIYPKDTSYEGKELLFDYRVRNNTMAWGGMPWEYEYDMDRIAMRIIHTLSLLGKKWGKYEERRAHHDKTAFQVNRWKSKIGLRKKHISYDSKFVGVFDNKTRVEADSTNILITMGSYFYEVYERIPIPEKDTFYRQKLDSAYTVVGIGLSYKQEGKTIEDVYIFNCINHEFIAVYSMDDWRELLLNPNKHRSTILLDNEYPLFYNQED